jgi:endonuclease YncB( thermonuclease family)
LDILSSIVVAILIVAIWKLSRPPVRLVRPQDVYVIDGDTITIPAGSDRREHVRISNIDAPEIRGFKSILQQKRGIAARDEVRFLIETAEVVEIRSQWSSDPFGRTLARVRVLNDRRQIDVGRHLVKNGLARAWNR